MNKFTERVLSSAWTSHRKYSFHGDVLSFYHLNHKTVKFDFDDTKNNDYFRTRTFLNLVFKITMSVEGV